MLSDSNQALNCSLFRLIFILICLEFRSVFHFLKGFNLIELCKKFLIFMILRNAALLDVKSKRNNLERVSTEGFVVSSHVVKQAAFIA